MEEKLLISENSKLQKGAISSLKMQIFQTNSYQIPPKTPQKAPLISKSTQISPQKTPQNQPNPHIQAQNLKLRNQIAQKSDQLSKIQLLHVKKLKELAEFQAKIENLEKSHFQEISVLKADLIKQKHNLARKTNIFNQNTQNSAEITQNLAKITLQNQKLTSDLQKSRNLAENSQKSLKILQFQYDSLKTSQKSQISALKAQKTTELSKQAQNLT